eukprot:Opistho-2@30044
MALSVIAALSTLLSRGARGQHPSEPAVAVPTCPVRETSVVMTEIVLPSHADRRSVCFGGQILAWIDICAGIAAKRLARRPCVTASVDDVCFMQPALAGEVVILRAMVNRSFKTSMEIGVRVESECLQTGERKYCCAAYLTFVCIDAAGRPQPVPQVIPETENEIMRFERADQKRKERLALKKVSLGGLTLDVSGGMQPPPHVTPVGQAFRFSSETLSHMTEIILPSQANTIGITFGGQIMAWMEQAAFISASRLVHGSKMLTAAVDSLHFLAPTRVGDIVYFVAQVTCTFTSSMEVAVSVYVEDPMDGNLKHCNNACLTIVAVNDLGAPVKAPQVVCESPEEKRRQAEAMQRREARLITKLRMKRIGNVAHT